MRCTPILHPPSAVVQGLWHKEPAQEVYLRRIAAGGGEILDPDLPPPSTLLYPTLQQLSSFVDEVQARGWCSVDLETAGKHIICVGMTAFTPGGESASPSVGTTVCLRFRTQGGSLYWDRFQDQVRAVELLGQVLEDPRVVKVFHNGVGFDVPLLLDLGFAVEGRILDTMILSWATYSELPRGLQYLSTLYLGAGVWKTLHDPKDGADVEADADESE